MSQAKDPCVLAAEEFMSRDNFFTAAPRSFMDDVCSEGVDECEVLRLITDRLEEKAREYAWAFRECRKGAM